MGTILASTSQADNATTTTATFAYDPSQVVRASCVLPAVSATQPKEPCQVTLWVSADNVTFFQADTRWFGLSPGGTYFQAFRLADYAGLAQQKWGLASQIAYYYLVFKGNTGAAVTIAATDDGQLNVATVTLTGINSTSGGQIGSWTPPEGGPVIITNLVVYATINSNGTANLSAGTAANAATNSTTLINAVAISGAAGTIIVSGTGTGASATGLIVSNGAVTFTGSANSPGFAAKAYISYIKP